MKISALIVYSAVASAPFPAAAQALQGSPQAISVAPAAPAFTYADLADLTLPASIIAEVTLRRATLLTPEEAPQVAAGHRRFLVESQVTALIRGPAQLPATIRYVVDIPIDARGRPATPRRRSAWLVFANAVPNRTDEVRLVAGDAQIAADPALADRTRALVREALADGAPPRITAIGRAFHVPGTLPGTGETQIFLQAANNQPLSITVNRTAADAPPTWFVSLSEFVDAGATRPQPNSLLWYRLACTLPAQLPAASLTESGEYRDQLVADYRVVRDGLGPCPRNRARR